MCQVRTCWRRGADPDTYIAKAANIPQGRLHPWIFLSLQLHPLDPETYESESSTSSRFAAATHAILEPDRWLTEMAP
jgi:hypothetical protein